VALFPSAVYALIVSAYLCVRTRITISLLLSLDMCADEMYAYAYTLHSLTHAHAYIRYIYTYKHTRTLVFIMEIAPIVSPRVNGSRGSNFLPRRTRTHEPGTERECTYENIIAPSLRVKSVHARTRKARPYTLRRGSERVGR
jgi:hypothetical protein